MTKFDFENGDKSAVDKPGARPKTLWAAWFRLSGSIYTEPVQVTKEERHLNGDEWWFATSGDDYVKSEGWDSSSIEYGPMTFASRNRDDVAFAIKVCTEYTKISRAYMLAEPEEYSE